MSHRPNTQWDPKQLVHARLSFLGLGHDKVSKHHALHHFLGPDVPPRICHMDLIWAPKQLWHLSVR